MIRRPPRSTLFPYTRSSDLLRSSSFSPSRSSCSSITRTASAPMPAEKRSEEHTSELQSQSNLVCRLLLEKKKKKKRNLKIQSMINHKSISYRDTTSHINGHS